MRNLVLKDAKWSFSLVHAKVKFPDELNYIEKKGVELIPFETVVDELCAAKHEFSMGSGTDLAEIVRYHPRFTVTKRLKSGRLD